MASGWVARTRVRTSTSFGICHSSKCTTKIKGLYKQSWVNWLTRYRYLDTPLYLGSVVERIPPGIHAKYRRPLSALNRHLKTPEVSMCAQQYSQIRFESAASKFLNRSMAALLNEKRKTPPAPHEERTGNRYPELMDRIQCRGNFLDYLPKMKGAAVEFYEILQKVISTKSSTQQVVLRAQWDAKVKVVREEIKQFREEPYDELQSLCAEKGIECPPMPKYPDILPLIDCSGSMSCAAQAPGVKSEKPAYLPTPCCSWYGIRRCQRGTLPVYEYLLYGPPYVDLP